MNVANKRAMTKSKMLKIARQSMVKLIFFILLLGFAYVILYPFLFKITAAFMSKEDLYDSMVNLVPRNWTLDNFKAVFKLDNFGSAFMNTAINALIVGVCSTASAALVGYGLGRFKFFGHKILTLLVILTMIIPMQTISLSLFTTFKYFDVFGIFKLLFGSPLQLTNTFWPFAILASSCLGFRAGIYVILMRQYYKGLPNELIEAAYVDGSGHFKTFFRIVLPMARSMLIVIFALSFAWQWTDTFYTGILQGGKITLSSLIITIAGVDLGGSSQYYYYLVLGNTAALVAIIPLFVVYMLLQRKIIEGIERSGLVG